MMRSDRVFQVHYRGKEYILHIEFEAGSDDELPSRLLVYNAVLYHDHHLPVITLVIYPFEVKMAVSPLIIPNSEHDIIAFHFHILPLFTLEAQAYVEQHNTCMYPLIPTMRGVHADMISQVLSELSELYHDDEATLSQQFVWIQLLLERTHTIEPLEKSKIQERLNMFDQLWEESPRVQKMREQMRKQYYEEGIAQARAEGIAQARREAEVEVETLQRTLIEIVRVKFPALTELAQKQVKQFDNPGALNLLLKKVLTAPDSKTAQWLLESNSEQ